MASDPFLTKWNAAWDWITDAFSSTYKRGIFNGKYCQETATITDTLHKFIWDPYLFYPKESCLHLPKSQLSSKQCSPNFMKLII